MAEQSADSLERLINLLKTAETAHGTYEEETLKGEYDANWADWYAKYLVEHEINNLIPNPTTPEKLAASITKLYVDHKVEAPTEKWLDFLAKKLQVADVS